MRNPLYIVAGGRSSRFGSDKARVQIDGEALIVRVARQLAAVSASTTVVADAAKKYADLGLTTIADHAPGHGPLGGLQTALQNSYDDWVLLVSCDFIGANPAWATLLLQHIVPTTQAVAFKGEQWQPLFALYHRSLRDTVTARIERGELALWKLLDDCGAMAVPLPTDWPAVPQINTPGDLEEWQRRR